MKLSSFFREREKFYQVTPYIAEFWNTISNILLILVGVYRLFTQDMSLLSQQLYTLMILCGFCSGIHHATPQDWTIVIDWIPIASSIYIVFMNNVIFYMDTYTIVVTAIVITWFLSDQFLHLTDPRIGHSLWHIGAAFALDAIYQSYMNGVCHGDLM